MRRLLRYLFGDGIVRAIDFDQASSSPGMTAGGKPPAWTWTVIARLTSDNPRAGHFT